MAGKRRPTCPTCKRGLPPRLSKNVQGKNVQGKNVQIAGAEKLAGVVEAARKAIANTQHANGLVCVIGIDAVLDLEQAVRELDRAQGRLVEEEMPF